MSLSSVKNISSFTVKELNCTGISRQRLLELGILKGVTISLKGFAPLGDPILIEVNDTKIALRKSDAKNIIVA